MMSRMMWKTLVNMCLLGQCISGVASVAVDAVPSLIPSVADCASSSHDSSDDHVVFCLMMHATSQMNEAEGVAAGAAGSNSPWMILDLSTCVADGGNAIYVGGRLLLV